jgi:hypothetical protein
MLDVEVEHEIAKQDQTADKIGVSTPGFVFEETSVFAPMVADFHAGPVVANGLQPLFGSSGVSGLTAQVIGVFPVGGFLFSVRPAAHMQDGLRVREVDVERIDGFYRDLSIGLAAVFLLEEGKRGESPAMPASARARTVFWLSFTCKR